MPDGTQMDSEANSDLFAQLDTNHPTQVWQDEFTRALQEWARYTPINFYEVADDGSPSGILGLFQGDERFGDIRLGAQAFGGLGYAKYPIDTYFGSPTTVGGDIILSSSYDWNIGTYPDLYSIFLHEIGHSLGLKHSYEGTVMYGSFSLGSSWEVYHDLTNDDIAGIQAIYGISIPEPPTLALLLFGFLFLKRKRQ